MPVVGFFPASKVSIHAPRAGRDHIVINAVSVQDGFNPRAPCGARLLPDCQLPDIRRFQSTRPVRGATLCELSKKIIRLVSIHAPRAGRDSAKTMHRPQLLVSIHAPRAGRDCRYPARYSDCQEFQSTRPVRGATPHATTTPRGSTCFNPRAPCGARPSFSSKISPPQSFNPRAPCGARPFSPSRVYRAGRFNPRAPCGARHRIPRSLNSA